MSDGSTNWGSAIMLILNGEEFLEALKALKKAMSIVFFLSGTKEEHLNMLEGGIIAKLLDEKWTTYAKVGERESEG